MAGIYDFKVPKSDGSELALSDYRGKVIIIVNTATGCGFTPHYEPLEQMYEDLHERGLEIVDIPCNQFDDSAPGSDDQIHEFCSLKYHTRFEQMKKAEVNGENQLPLYAYLKEQKGFTGFGKGPMAFMMKIMMKRTDRNYKKNSDIKWNFTKFIIDRDGSVVARFEPTEDMDKVRMFVEGLI